MSPRRPPGQGGQVIVEQSYPIREILLVVGIVAFVVAVMWMAAMAYRPSHIQAKVANEATFLSSATSHLRAVFADANYRGAGEVWKAAQERQEAWTQSPNGWNWSLVPVALDGTFPVACGGESGRRCSALSFRYDHRTTTDLSAPECIQLLQALNTDLEVQSIRAGGMTADIAMNLCDRTSPSAPPFLYVVAR